MRDEIDSELEKIKQDRNKINIALWPTVSTGGEATAHCRICVGVRLIPQEKILYKKFL